MNIYRKYTKARAVTKTKAMANRDKGGNSGRGTDVD